MKAKFLILALVVLISGCGMFRKVFKSNEYSKLDTKSEVRKDSVGVIIDKSVTTIKEKVDTIITLPGQMIRQDSYLNMDSLVNGMTAVKNDILDVRLVLNPVTGILSAIATIKPQKVQVKINKETVKQNDITQQAFQSELWSNSLKQSSGSSQIEKEPMNVYWYVIGLVILIIITVSFRSWWKNHKV